MKTLRRRKPVDPPSDPGPDRAPEGAPAWITADLIRYTKKIFEPLYDRALSTEEASTMLVSAGRIFELLSRR